MWTCSRCGREKRQTLIAMQSNFLCVRCLISLPMAARLIKKLKDIDDIDAPLGYEMVGSRYFMDEEVGRLEADRLFFTNRMQLW